MRLCSYVVKYDTGLAPNPFWSYCTLAVCTPNHMGIRAQIGDWFIGNQLSKLGNKLVFAMQVSETLHFNDYYHDTRFEEKKPVKNGPWEKRCGDNMYFINQKGKWEKHPSLFHQSKADLEKDTRNPHVYIAEHFYYFGEAAVMIPHEFSSLIQDRQGCKCNHEAIVVEQFLGWLRANFQSGKIGNPRDWDDKQNNLSTLISIDQIQAKN